MFTQDEVTTHTARRVNNVTQANFPDERAISSIFPIAWPAWSADLNPCDIWLRCFLKDLVYHGHVTCSRQASYHSMPRILFSY